MVKYDKKLAILVGIASIFALLVVDFLFRVYLREEGGCVINEGFAFGLKFANPWVVNLAKALLIVLVSYLTVFELRKPMERRQSLIFGYMFIILSAVSILIERLVFGGICDYIQILPKTSLYVNLADIIMVLALICVAYKINYGTLSKSVKKT